MDKPRSRAEGWRTGGAADVYSETHKYDDQTHLIVFVRNMIHLAFKNHILEGGKTHVSIRETKAGEGMGGG